ncbi:PGF-CTERM protein [Natronoarchaeum philippinense]|uniref:PGF-CTERM protein n=1 Tax=Natronoarchaeum philippinense TaxID=558529 RepID=A0A285N8A2_NATPI|nr:PQQ-binding-like beta-propeller repeat protein [Natronoarchaeum philippinense]SNZ05640.1 PGF-CTERM protein [Natronoarchaeum philippinense]
MKRRSFLTRCCGVGLGLVGLGTAGVASSVAAPGDSVWSVEMNGSFGGPPTIVDGTVYAGSDNPPDMPTETMYALDAETGDEQWSTAVPTIDNSPTVVDGTVYVDARSGVRALDAATGEQLWDRPLGGAVETSPTVADGTVYVGHANTVVALDAETGDHLWEFRTEELGAGTPTVVGGTVYVGSSPNVKDSEDRGVFAIDAETGEERWQHRTASYVDAAPTVAGGSVFVGDTAGNLYRIDAESGQQQWNAGTSDGVYDMVTVADGIVCAPSFDGTLHGFDLGGDQQWSKQLDGQIGSPPTIAGGSSSASTAYVTTDAGKLYALDLQSGEIHWETGTANATPTGPTVVDGVAYLGGDEMYLEAIELEGGSSIGSRVRLGTLGHTSSWTGGPVALGDVDAGGDGGQSDEPEPVQPEDVEGGGDDEASDSASDDGDTSEFDSSEDETEPGGETGSNGSGGGGASGSDSGTPGFGVPAAIAAVGGASYALGRSTDDGDAEDAAE